MADYLNVTEIWHQARPMAEKALSAVIDEPAHLIVEAVLLIFVLILLCKRSYRIPKAVAPAPLTESVRRRGRRDERSNWKAKKRTFSKRKDFFLKADKFPEQCFGFNGLAHWLDETIVTVKRKL